MELTKDFKLKHEIEEILLKFADLSEDICRSDLQGIAMAKSQEIINLVRNNEV